MSGNKSTATPKEAVEAVAVRGTPQAELDATLDESLRSLPMVDASERPVFGPLNRSAPSATENIVVAEDSSMSTPAGTPSKSDAEDRSKSSRSSGDVSGRSESGASIPYDTTGSVDEAIARVDEGRRLSPIRAGEVGVGAVNGESGANIPFDSTVSSAETTGTSASATAPLSLSAEATIRELHAAVNATPEQGPSPYGRLELDDSGTPLKPINESSEPSGSSVKDNSWLAAQTYRTLSPEKSLEAAQASNSTATPAETVPSTPASAAEASIDSLPSASIGASEASAVSSPPASPSTPNASAEAAASIAESSSVATLPSASTGGLNASTLSTPPATPETSAQAAVRVIHEELRGVTPSKKLRVDREYMDLKNSPMPAVLERTEPSLEAGNNEEPLWLRNSSAESSNTSDPKPKAVKRRLPTDAVPNDRSTPRRLPLRARRSRLSSSSSASSGPCCSKDVPRSRRHCPTCRCEDTMFPPIDEVSNALSDFNGYFEEDAPAADAAPALDALSSDDSSVEEDPLADMMSDDEVPAEPPVPACPRCGRNCTCVPVQIPEEVVPPRRRAPRRQPKMSLEDAWKALKFIDDFEMADLPAPPSKFDNNFNLLEFRPLTKDRIKKYGCTDDFQVALYDDGEVVFQGSFPGVPTTTEVLRRATYQPMLAYHVPEDPVKDIEVGDDFFVMVTEAGHLLSLGANDVGQLGATAFPSRFRQRAVTPASMRRFPKAKEHHVGEVVFKEIQVIGKTVFAKDEGGFTYRCGEGFKSVLIWEHEREERRR